MPRRGGQGGPNSNGHYESRRSTGLRNRGRNRRSTYSRAGKGRWRDDYGRWSNGVQIS